MEFLNDFGVNWLLLIAQIVNFLIIFFVLKKFLYKPVLELLKNRENTIKKGLEQAEEARQLLEQANEKERAMLRTAQDEAKKLLAEARAERIAQTQATEEATRKQADKILKEAREQIATDSAAAEKRLSAHISELAVTFLQKSVSELVTKEDQEVVLKNTLRRMKSKTN